MKKTFLAASMLLVSVCFTETSYGANAATGGWSDQQNCLRGAGDCGWCVTAQLATYNESQIPVTITILDDHSIKISYERELVASTDDAILDLGDVVIPAAVCQSLGVASITILQGSYQPNYSDNAFGDYVMHAIVTH